MKRIIVTGGAGFIGSNLVLHLQREYPSADILVIDDFRTGSFANLSREGPDGVTFRGEVLARSLLDLDLWDAVESFDPDCIFHEAAITDTTVMDEALMMQVNAEPFETLLALAVEKGIKLVWASSAATYGRDAKGAAKEKRPFKLGDAGQPANVYGFSKWVMENMARRAMLEYPDSHIVGLRYFNVFGPGEANKGKMASMIYQLAKQMLAGKRPRIFADGEQARDHVYVGDVVGCTAAGGLDTAVSGVYNVGAGVATSFNQIVAALNEALGTSLAPDYFENPYKFYQDYTCAELADTRKGLRWKPQHEVKKAIGEYAQWLKRNG